MNRFAAFALPLLMLSVACGASAEDGKRTLEGSYVWTAGAQGSLTATFSPSGEPDRWTVEFHFDFDGPHVYAGTAMGKLDEGSLRGEVRSDGRERTFTFRGSFEDGKFKGTHTETTRGRKVDTGTLKLQ